MRNSKSPEIGISDVMIQYQPDLNKEGLEDASADAVPDAGQALRRSSRVKSTQPKIASVETRTSTSRKRKRKKGSKKAEGRGPKPNISQVSIFHHYEAVVFALRR